MGRTLVPGVIRAGPQLVLATHRPGKDGTRRGTLRFRLALSAHPKRAAPPSCHLPIHLPSTPGRAPGRALRLKLHNSLPPLNSTLTAEQSSDHRSGARRALRRKPHKFLPLFNSTLTAEQSSDQQGRRQRESKCPSVKTAVPAVESGGLCRKSGTTAVTRRLPISTHNYNSQAELGRSGRAVFAGSPGPPQVLARPLSTHNCITAEQSSGGALAV